MHALCLGGWGAGYRGWKARISVDCKVRVTAVHKVYTMWCIVYVPGCVQHCLTVQSSANQAGPGVTCCWRHLVTHETFGIS